MRLRPTSLKRPWNSDKVFVVTGLIRKRNWVSKKAHLWLEGRIAGSPVRFFSLPLFSPPPTPALHTPLLKSWPSCLDSSLYLHPPPPSVCSISSPAEATLGSGTVWWLSSNCSVPLCLFTHIWCFGTRAGPWSWPDLGETLSGSWFWKKKNTNPSSQNRRFGGCPSIAGWGIRVNLNALLKSVLLSSVNSHIRLGYLRIQKGSTAVPTSYQEDTYFFF